VEEPEARKLPRRAVLNFADHPVRVVVDPPDETALGDRITGSAVPTGPVDMPAYGAAILSPPP